MYTSLIFVDIPKFPIKPQNSSFPTPIHPIAFAHIQVKSGCNTGEENRPAAHPNSYKKRLS